MDLRLGITVVVNGVKYYVSTTYCPREYWDAPTTNYETAIFAYSPDDYRELISYEPHSLTKGAAKKVHEHIVEEVKSGKIPMEE